MGFIPIILIIIANAILKAVNDTLIHHYSNSIFKNLDPDFWDPDISWKKAYIDGDPKKGEKKIIINLFLFNIKLPYPHFIKDAWHLSNTIQLFLWLLLPYFDPITFEYNQILSYLLLGGLYITIFNLFYNHIFYKHKK